MRESLTLTDIGGSRHALVPGHSPGVAPLVQACVSILTLTSMLSACGGGSSNGTSAAAPTPPTQFWVPFQSAGTQSAVYVIPSNSLTTTPIAVAPGATNPHEIAIAYDGNPRGTGPYAPATAMFVATDSNNQLQVYGLNLAMSSQNSVPPAAGPLGRAYPAGSILCYAYGIQTNYNDPNTLFAIVAIDTSPTDTTGPSFNPMTGRCPALDPIAYEVVPYDPSLSTQKLNEAIFYIDWTVQDDGQLGGVVAQVGSQLWFYPHGDFSPAGQPTRVASTIDVMGSGYIGSGVLNSVFNMGGALRTSGFERIGFEAVTATDGSTTVWRVDPSGTSSFVYEVRSPSLLPGNAAGDTANLYFVDGGDIVSAESHGNAQSTVVYHYPGVLAPPGYGAPHLIGSTGSSILLSTYTQSAGVVASVPVGTGTATTYTELLTLPNNVSFGGLLDAQSRTLFVGEADFSGAGPSGQLTGGYQSFVGTVGAAGPATGVTKPLTSYSGSGSIFFQVQGAAPTYPSVSGSTLSTYDTTMQTASAPLHDSSGKTFVFPTATNYWFPGCLAVFKSTTGGGIHLLQINSDVALSAGGLAFVDTTQSLVEFLNNGTANFIPWL